MSDDSLGCLSIIAIVVLLIWLTGINPFKSQIHAYPQEYRCNESGSCKWVNLPIYTYVPIIETQKVVFYRNVEHAFPFSLKNCVVASVDTWSCETWSESGKFGFSMGDYKPEHDFVNTRFVSKFKWWRNSLL